MPTEYFSDMMLHYMAQFTSKIRTGNGEIRHKMELYINSGENVKQKTGCEKNLHNHIFSETSTNE